MRKIFLIGVGPGDPDYLTIQAIKAMNRADVFFLFEKPGRGKNQLIDIRKTMLRKYVKGKKHRIVSAQMPDRDRKSAAYESAVADWRDRKRDLMAELIKNNLKRNQTGAFLIWGDPSLYDGSIEMLHSIQAAGELEFDLEIVPGITCIQALTQKHKIPLNRAGESVWITTGRRLNENSAAAGADTVVVLLDQHAALKDFADKDAELYWGAYLGTKDEILLSGRLKDVVARYRKIKTASGRKKGWIMDTYLLRKRKPHK